MGEGAEAAGGANIGSLRGCGSGGGGALQGATYISVVPNIAYTVTIGSGGSGGSYSLGGGNNGNDGSDTSFSSLAVFAGAGGGYGDNGNNIASGGGNTRGPLVCESEYQGAAVSITPAGGGLHYINDSQSGQRNTVGGYAGGIAGTTDGAGRIGGTGGGAGPKGAGGNGANGGSSTNGSSASANTGGGGGGGADSTSTSNGGDGGSGYLYIIYIE